MRPAPLRTSIGRHTAILAGWLAGVLAASVGMAPAAAATLARPLTVCVSLNPVPPLTYPHQDGQAQQLVRQAMQRLGGQVQFMVVPWLRCRLGVKTGAYDAALPMVASPEFTDSYAFPLLKGGIVDSGRAVGQMTISVMRRAGSAVEWDGSNFQKLATPVMVLPGQRAARDKLKALGVAEDTESTQADSLLRKLVAERREVAVLPTGIAQAALADDEFRGRLELLPNPLAVEWAYLSFNREFEHTHAGFVQSLWAELARLRANQPLPPVSRASAARRAPSAPRAQGALPRSISNRVTRYRRGTIESNSMYSSRAWYP